MHSPRKKSDNLEKFITPNDIERSRTARGLGDIYTLLQTLKGRKAPGRMLDVGCGYGGLTMLVGSYLDVQSIHGIDIDKSVLPEAKRKGVKTKKCDIAKGPLPYPDNYFDLVISFGMLDYLPWFDNAIIEMHRVLKPGSKLVISLPNLSSWNNRLALLLGYQPREAEISQKVIVGVHPYHKTRRGYKPGNHVHVTTLRAFSELAEYFGFETLFTQGLTPGRLQSGIVLNWLDQVFKHRPSLARRFVWVGKKNRKSK